MLLAPLVADNDGLAEAGGVGLVVAGEQVFDVGHVASADGRQMRLRVGGRRAAGGGDPRRGGEECEERSAG